MPKPQPIKNRKSELINILDVFFVPSSIIRLMRRADRDGAFEGSKIRRAIGYSSAVGLEVCRLGFCYGMIVEPIYKALTQG